MRETMANYKPGDICREYIWRYAEAVHSDVKYGQSNCQLGLCTGESTKKKKGGDVFRVGIFLFSLGGQAPHVPRAHMGHRCGEPTGIELAPIGVKLNGSAPANQRAVQSTERGRFPWLRLPIYTVVRPMVGATHGTCR